MSTLRRLKQLYAKIPTFDCIPGCTDCCGPVPFSRAEWGRVQNKKTATGPDCPYSLNGGCDIYEQRPFVCRLFGASEEPLLTCPHGKMPPRKLTAEETSALMKAYVRLEHE